MSRLPLLLHVAGKPIKDQASSSMSVSTGPGPYRCCHHQQGAISAEHERHWGRLDIHTPLAHSTNQVIATYAGRNTLQDRQDRQVQHTHTHTHTLVGDGSHMLYSQDSINNSPLTHTRTMLRYTCCVPLRHTTDKPWPPNADATPCSGWALGT
jgi:hypothetical protein